MVHFLFDKIIKAETGKTYSISDLLAIGSSHWIKGTHWLNMWYQSGGGCKQKTDNAKARF